MSTVQGIALAAAAVFLLQVFLLTARRRLRDRHAFVWLLLGLLAVAVAAAIPGFDALADRVGVAYPPALIFLAGFYLILTILMYQTAVISHQQDSLKALAQEIAYLRKEVQDTTEPAQSASAVPNQGARVQSRRGPGQ